MRRFRLNLRMGNLKNLFDEVSTPPVPDPAPSFTVQPSISHDGTPQVGETLTGSDGTILNGTVSARQWLLNGSAISGATGASYVPDTVGDISYRVTATGTGGSTQATSSAVTVAPAPTPSPTVLINGSSPSEETLIDTITTPTGRWPIYYLGVVDDARVYRWAKEEDPTWWRISVHRYGTASNAVTELLTTITVNGDAQEVRTCNGSIKSFDSHEPVTPSLTRLKDAVDAFLAPYFDGPAVYADFPTARDIATTTMTTLAQSVGYRPDMIYARQSAGITTNSTLGNVSGGTGEDMSSRSHVSETDAMMIAASIQNNAAAFATHAATARLETLYGSGLPHLCIWSPNHHHMKDAQVPFAGDKAYKAIGSATGTLDVYSAGNWTAPVGYPYLADLGATGGSVYAHSRDDAHLFNHSWAYWLATGDPLAALIQQGVFNYVCGFASHTAARTSYITRFGYQRPTGNLLSAMFKIKHLDISSDNGLFVWPQSRRDKMYNDLYADWQAKQATLKASANAEDQRQAAFKAIDDSPGTSLFSDFMMIQYVTEAAYLMASKGQTDVLKLLAEHVIIRTYDIGGAMGGEAAGSNFFAIGGVSAPAATTMAGLITEVFIPTGRSQVNLNDVQSMIGARLYAVLLMAQDAVNRGWITAPANLAAAISAHEASMAATTTWRYPNLLFYKHTVRPHPL